MSKKQLQLYVTIQLSGKYSFNVKKQFLFQTIQLSTSTQLKCKYGLIVKNRVDLGAMAMKGYSAFPKSSSTAGTSPSDCLVLYPGHSLGAEVQRCSQCILQPQPTGQYTELNVKQFYFR